MGSPFCISGVYVVPSAAEKYFCVYAPFVEPGKGAYFFIQ